MRWGHLNPQLGLFGVAKGWLGLSGFLSLSPGSTTILPPNPLLFIAIELLSQLAYPFVNNPFIKISSNDFI